MVRAGASCNGGRDISKQKPNKGEIAMNRVGVGALISLLTCNLHPGQSLPQTDSYWRPPAKSLVMPSVKPASQTQSRARESSPQRIMGSANSGAGHRGCGFELN